MYFSIIDNIESNQANYCRGSSPQKEIKMEQSAYIDYYVESQEIYDENDDEIGVDTFWLIAKNFVPVESRGKGIARKLMTDAIADMQSQRKDLKIALWCEAQDDETDSDKLCEFYESFGFVATGNGAEMVLLS